MLVLEDNEDCYAIGDHIEVGIDGVVRTVTAITYEGIGDNRTQLHISPSLDKRKFSSFLLLNWKTSTNYVKLMFHSYSDFFRQLMSHLRLGPLCAVLERTDGILGQCHVLIAHTPFSKRVLLLQGE